MSSKISPIPHFAKLVKNRAAAAFVCRSADGTFATGGTGVPPVRMEKKHKARPNAKTPSSPLEGWLTRPVAAPCAKQRHAPLRCSRLCVPSFTYGARSNSDESNPSANAPGDEVRLPGRGRPVRPSPISTQRLRGTETQSQRPGLRVPRELRVRFMLSRSLRVSERGRPVRLAYPLGRSPPIWYDSAAQRPCPVPMTPTPSSRTASAFATALTAAGRRVINRGGG